MESQSQNPEFRINSENFHPCKPQRQVFLLQGPFYFCIKMRPYQQCRLK